MTSKQFAIAIDLGTTTLAGSLLDISTGNRYATVGAMNPQIRYGADVLSRVQAATSSEKTFNEMTQAIRCKLWDIIQELCDKGGITPSDLDKIAIAGNTTMQHILLAWPLQSLVHPPYRPKHTEGVTLSAQEFDWNSDSTIYLFPMPGGFVGGDTVAFIYGELSYKSPDTPEMPPTLYLDMGTNGEIALINYNTIWATSAAAGPAFEGGNLSCGMVALPGAINSLLLNNETLKITTIENRPPLGICGSAAIQAIDQFLCHNIIEPTGRMKNSVEISSNLSTRVIDQNGENAFVLHRDAAKLLTLSQGDIRQIQLAKSAIRAGIEVLFHKSALNRNSLSSTVLTGSFGAFLEPDWLKSIGIFDQIMLQTTRFTPEGALKGVEQALLANDCFLSVEAVSKRFKIIPLSGTPSFEKLFIDNINFPPLNK